MKKLIILPFFIAGLLGISLKAQTVMNFNKIHRAYGGSTLKDIRLITESRGVMITNKGPFFGFHIFGRYGDSIKSFKPARYAHFLALAGNGVVIAFDQATTGKISGFSMDTNGVLIDSFDHNLSSRTLPISYQFMDSYVDHLGNCVAYFSRDSTFAFSYPMLITFNQLGQIVKIKHYKSLYTDPDSKMIVKDGKLWGFTCKVSNGLVGIGIDTAGATGQRYYLFRSQRFNDFSYPIIVPYKRNGYYAISPGQSAKMVQKSEVGGTPIMVDSTGYLGFPAPLWATSDSSRISIYRTNSNLPLTFKRIAENGSTLFSTLIPQSTRFNVLKFFAFGDGSALIFGQYIDNNDTLGYLYPYVLVRISDMGYPYDPWKQQVVFRGVTGAAKEQERTTVLAYPNPTQDRLKFLGIAEGNIRLVDATGKELLNQTLTEEGISMAHLPRGLYRYLLTYRGKYYQGSVVRE